MSGKLTKAFNRFHGKNPRASSTLEYTPPKGFIVLGDAVAVEYRCDKLNGGGDGTQAVYRHTFDKGAKLLMDQTTRRQLYIVGSKIKVTSAGIEH